MEKSKYTITQNNNELFLFSEKSEQPIYQSFWYMEFGKTCAEIRNENGKKLYSVTKKFQFWKWRMVYLITKNVNDKSILISQNSRNTIFKIALLEGDYEIKVHYKKKKSIYKNNIKIAEFNELLAEKNDVKLLVSTKEELEIIFLLYACLLIGINDFASKTVLKSQKQLEKNTEPWF